MNIVGIGFYDDFARFFNALKKEACKRKATFYYVTIFSSGFLYGLAKLSVFTWLTPSVWCKYIVNKKKYLQSARANFYKNIDLAKVAKYHVTSDPIHENYYRMVSCAYIDFAYSYLIRKKADVLIVSGDSRMQCVAFIEVAKKLDIKIYYFEQGAFDTTFVDTVGVNANSIVRQIAYFPVDKYVDHKDVLTLTINKNKNKKFKRLRFFRGIDKIINIFLIYFFSRSEITERFPKPNQSVQKNTLAKKPEDKPLVLFAAQVPHDVNMITHSPVFVNHYNIIKFLNENVPDIYQIVVREHPLYKGRYEKEFYNYIYEQERIILDNTTPLHSIINSASLVAVNNSTVGIESLALGKRVFVTGAAYYDTFCGVWSVNNPDDVYKLKEGDYVLSESEHEISLKELSILFTDFLYAGHFRDEDLNFTAEIMDDIINGEVKSGKVNVGRQSCNI